MTAFTRDEDILRSVNWDALIATPGGAFPQMHSGWEINLNLSGRGEAASVTRIILASRILPPLLSEQAFHAHRCYSFVQFGRARGNIRPRNSHACHVSNRLSSFRVRFERLGSRASVLPRPESIVLASVLKKGCPCTD